jgi:inorganic phosphate transporter, PiT family
MTLILVLLAVLFVAYTNGANDNFKGVATLFGSGTTDYKRALGWGTVTTLAGSITALFLSEQLVKTFTGAGLVPDALVGSPTFVGAVALGTASTVFLATQLSYPISTTHALTGSLIGAGLVMGGTVHFDVLGSKFFLPLLVSPLLGTALIAILYPLLRRLRLLLEVGRESCVLVEGQWVPASRMPGGPAALAVAAQQERYLGTVLAIPAQQTLDAAHYLSAGAVSFARGLNDTPKIVALLMAAQVLSLRSGVALVGGVMAVGAILSARRVAEKMGKGITEMNNGQGFAANLVTSVLVLGASRFGVPVSTTHVSCGALFGLGAVTGQVRWKVVASIVLAWVITLPVATVLSSAVAFVLTR